MARVVFTAHLRKHVACDTAEVAGPTVAAALDAVFRDQPELRGYVLDDQGRVRRHVMIFVDESPLRDRDRLTDAVGADSEIHVVQALSGG